MRSDLLAQIQAAATGAQDVAGEPFTLQGNPAGPFRGTFGSPQIDVTGTVGGVRQRVVLPLVCTRTQFAAIPGQRITLTRTDTGQRYTVESVSTHDAIHYMLMLVELGTGR